MSQFILVLHGPWCAGKSTAATSLFARHRKLFFASRDKILWLISDYYIDKDPSDPLIDDMVRQLAESALNKGFSVVVEAGGMFRPRGQQEVYKDLAATRGIALFQVNIEAPLEILTTRFNARLASKPPRPSSKTNHALMMERYDIYMAHKDASLETLDSSRLSPPELVAQLERIIKLTA